MTNLQDVSDLGPFGEKIGKKTGEERRRVPRMALTHEVFRHQGTGRLFSVSDLSLDGMGIRIRDESDLALFPLGQPIEGELGLTEVKTPVRARVQRVGRSTVGLAWERMTDSSLSSVKDFLDPDSLASAMRLSPAPEGVDLWYHGHSGVDLWIWGASAPLGFERVLFILRGRYFEWNAFAGQVELQTGSFAWSRELSEERGAVCLENMTLVAEIPKKSDEMRVAKKFLLGCNLPEKLKNSLILALNPFVDS